MKLSAPIYRLKHQAKLLAREGKLSYCQALDKIANQEGFDGWSLLARHYANSAVTNKILQELKPGDLLLLAARPEQGKTLFASSLLTTALRLGLPSKYYTLCEKEIDVLARIKSESPLPVNFEDVFTCDASDDISAPYIIERSQNIMQGSLIVIDYLQMLDEQRQKPSVDKQVLELKVFAREFGIIIIFISQIDRSFDCSFGNFPTFEDVRLPNPLNLSLFDKACFLNDGEVKFERAA